MTSTTRASLAIAAVALVAMAPVLVNGLVSDDIELVVARALVHGPAGLWGGFSTPWWPAPSPDGLYRPLAITGLTLQHLLGGGASWVFHLSSLLLYAATAVVLLRLLARVVSPAAAFAGALLFAAHPLHTEGVALAVNQGELVVALVALLMAGWLLDAVREGTGGPALWVRLVLAQLVALGSKEHAAVIPALLLALVAAVTPRPRAELRARAPLLLGLVVATVGFWSVRTIVLGDIAGAAPAPGLPESFGARAVAMLGIVPTWVRLLVWPADLQVDYSPRELPPYSGEGAAPFLGTLLLLVWAITLAATWRRRPAAAIGLVWLPLAIAPVSNLVLPTGIWVAERTLFLASVGIAFIVAALWEELAARMPVRPLLVVLALVTGAGVLRSAVRMRDWRDTPTQIAAMVRDAPESYRAQMAAGTWAFDSLGDRRLAERHLRAAIRLWPHHPEPLQALADRYRSDGMCGAAIPLYITALAQVPDRGDLRASLLACHFHRGEWGAAAEVARASAIPPAMRDWFARVATTADSAGRAGVPPRTLVVPGVVSDLVSVGRRPR